MSGLHVAPGEVSTDLSGADDPAYQAYADGTDGLRYLDPTMDAAAALARGDWVEAGVNAALAGLDLADVVADPLAGVCSAVADWALDHCQGFQDLLDELVGDAEAITAAAATWRRIGGLLDSVGDEYADRVRRDLGAQRGLTVTAYRGAAVAARGHFTALTGSATGVAEGILLAGSLLGTVRAFVQAKLADAIGAAVVALGTTVATGGTAAPAAGTRLALKAAGLLKECRDLVAALRTSLSALGRLVETVSRGMTSTAKRCKEGFEGADTRDLVRQFVEAGVQRTGAYDV